MRKKKIDWWQELIHTVPSRDANYQSKMEFATTFLNSFNITGSDDTKIKMGSITLETLTYFVYAIITKYDEIIQKNPPRDHI
jgi:hypothetical protein